MNATSERARWLEARRTGIGGSDAPVVLGVSKWKTPYALWQDKRGEIPVEVEEDTEPMRWGRALEPVIRQEYAERTGREVRLPRGILRHPEHEFMLASLDGLTDDGRVLEIKTSRSGAGWGEPGSDEVPPEYLIQVQHYLAVTGLAVADVAVLIAGSEFRLYEVIADAELQSILIEEEARFWRLVREGVPPDPVSLADVRARYGRMSRAGCVVARAALREQLDRLRALKAQIKAMQDEADLALAQILAEMGEADTLVDERGQTLATWKLAKPGMRFDAKAFEAAHPELYARFLVESEPSRRFLLK